MVAYFARNNLGSSTFSDFMSCQVLPCLVLSSLDLPCLLDGGHESNEGHESNAGEEGNEGDEGLGDIAIECFTPGFGGRGVFGLSSPIGKSFRFVRVWPDAKKSPCA